MRAGRELAPLSTARKIKATVPQKAFPSRAAEGEYLSLKRYKEQTRALKHKLDKRGAEFAKFSQAVTEGSKMYHAQHVTHQQHFLPNSCDMLSVCLHARLHTPLSLRRATARDAIAARHECHECHASLHSSCYAVTGWQRLAGTLTCSVSCYIKSYSSGFFFKMHQEIY